MAPIILKDKLFRQRMLQRFDANHDGQLDDSEKAKMRAFKEQRRLQGIPKGDLNGGYKQLLGDFDKNPGGQSFGPPPTEVAPGGNSGDKQ